MTAKDAKGDNSAIVAPVVLTFEITDTKQYVPVVTLSKENGTKLLEQLKSGFKNTIKWHKYRSQITIESKNNNLNYLIHPPFTNVNRLFVLPFTRTDTRDYRYAFSNYYVPNAEIKDFNVLIDRKGFFDLPVKNEEQASEKIIKISNNNDYTTGNLLDFANFKNHYKLIAIDLSKQTKLKDLQQISFIAKLSNMLGATMFFITEQSEETTFNFSQNFVTII